MSTKQIISVFFALATSTALLGSHVNAQSVPAQAAIVTNAAEAPTMMGGKATKPELPARDQWMNLKQAYEALEKAGYKDIQSIHSSRMGYIATLQDAEQKRVRLLIHPTEGTVSVVERTHGDKRRHSHHRKDRENQS